MVLMRNGKKMKSGVWLPVLLCGLAAHATQYVVPGGAGDESGGSWANARADVQTAVDAAALPGEEVWVAGGRYEVTAPDGRGRDQHQHDPGLGVRQCGRRSAVCAFPDRRRRHVELRRGV